MSSFDDFVHIPFDPSIEPQYSTSSNQEAESSFLSTNGSIITKRYLQNARGPRICTEIALTSSIRSAFPKHFLTVTPVYNCDLIAFADTRDDTSYSAHGDPNKTFLQERLFIPPARRYNDETGGQFVDRLLFGRFDYTFQGHKFIVYIAEGGDGVYGKPTYNYILVAPKEHGQEMSVEEKVEAQQKTDNLIRETRKWAEELHDEVLIFDAVWQKNKDLWKNVQKSKWEDVILEKEKKEALIEDVIGFFDNEERYKEFGIPWKRGVIFYGPPGNGKTISTKALMNDLSKRVSPSIQLLYVKSFRSYMGPEAGIRQIFLQARQMAPCVLVFEDIDSLVDVSVRSYFLNEVDGLESNHGILMIGSTNHLERLDPGIAKRPSRFDRKYLFDVPDRKERVQYADYWRNKLKDNKKIEFPEELSEKVADITGNFSFAYMKEAFVAALLVIVGRSEKGNGRRGMKWKEDGLNGNVLWVEIQRQVANLRKEMEEESEKSAEDTILGMSMSSLGLSPLRDDERSTTRTRPITITNARYVAEDMYSR